MFFVFVSAVFFLLLQRVIYTFHFEAAAGACKPEIIHLLGQNCSTTTTTTSSEKNETQRRAGKRSREGERF